jgi:hypothetical protein
VVGDQSPRLADVGLQRDRTFERRQSLVAPAGESQRHAALVLHCCGPRLATSKWFENRQRARQVAKLAPRHAEEQDR